MGHQWLQQWNPNIDWETGDVQFQFRDGAEDTPVFGIHQIDANRSERREWLRAGIVEDSKDEVWILAGYTYSQAIAVEANRDKYAKSFEELVPKEYHRHKKVFSEEESHRLSELCRVLNALEGLFIDVDNPEQPSRVVAHVSSWLKFSYLSELLVGFVECLKRDKF